MRYTKIPLSTRINRKEMGQKDMAGFTGLLHSTISLWFYRNGTQKRPLSKYARLMQLPHRDKHIITFATYFD